MTAAAERRARPRPSTSPRRSAPAEPPGGRAQAGDGALRRRDGLDGARRAKRPRGVAADHGALLRDPLRGRPPLRGHGRQVHRRRHHGPVRRADRPRGPRPARLLRGAPPAATSWPSYAAELRRDARGSTSRPDGPQLRRGGGRRDRRGPRRWTTPRSATPSGLAQRMEQLAEPGKAYLTEHTAALVEGYLALADLGEFEVKGASRPLRVHELTGVGAARGRLDVSRARGFSRFVGRDEELQVLENALEQADGRPGAGDRDRRRGRRRQEPPLPRVRRALPGEGHPRLPHQPARRTPSRSRCCRCCSSCAPTSTSPSRTPTRRARERIAGKLLLLDESFGDDLPLIFDFLAVPDPERPAPRMDPEARQRQLLARDQAPDPRPERARARRQPVRGPALARPRERGVPRQPRRGDPGDARPDDPQLPARVPRRVDVEVLLPPDRPGSARPRGDRGDARRPARLRPLARRAAGRSFASAPAATRSSSRRSCSRWSRPGTSRASAAPTGSSGRSRRRRCRRACRRSSRRGSTGSDAREKAVLQAAAVIGKEFPEPVLAQVVELEPAGARGRASRAGRGRVRLRAGALPRGDLRLQAPADPGGGLRLAARRAPVPPSTRRSPGRSPSSTRSGSTSARRCWPSTGRPPARRSRRRAGTRAPRLDRDQGPDRVAAPLAKVRELADSLPDSEETAALGLAARIFLAPVRLAPRHLPRGGGALFTEAERMASAGGGHDYPRAPALGLRGPSRHQRRRRAGDGRARVPGDRARRGVRGPGALHGGRGQLLRLTSSSASTGGQWRSSIARSSSSARSRCHRGRLRGLPLRLGADLQGRLPRRARRARRDSRR